MGVWIPLGSLGSLGRCTNFLFKLKVEYFVSIFFGVFFGNSGTEY